MARCHTNSWAKIIKSILITTCAIFASTAESTEEMTADAIDLIRPSTVQIMYLESAQTFPSNKKSLGTGFFVSNKGYVITANHVLEGARKLISSRRSIPSKKDVYIGVSWPNKEITNKDTGKITTMTANFNLYEFEVIDIDSQNDLALLKIKIDIFKKNSMVNVANLDVRRPRDGTAIAVSGYPLNEPVLITNAGIISTTWANKGSSQSASTRPTYVYLADVVANPGNSGGAVYTINGGAVIGVCVAGRIRNIQQKTPKGLRAIPSVVDFAGLTVVVPIKHAVSLLEKNGVQWSKIKN